jgi:hypothetical protein
MRILPTFGLIGLLGGCVGQGVIAHEGTGYMWEGTGTRSGPGTFVTAQCPGGTRAIDGEAYGKTCTRVTVAKEPPGREAYSYVWKLKHRALIGIPYGEEPITVYVVGDRAECDKQASAHPEHGNTRLSADPAERCAGPVWIR